MNNKSEKIEIFKEKINNNKICLYLKENINFMLVCLLTAYIMASVLNIFLSDTKIDTIDFVTSISGIRTFLLFFVFSVVLCLFNIIGEIGKKIIYTLLLISVSIFAFMIVYVNNDNFYLVTGVAVLISFFIYFILTKGILFENKIINSYIVSFIILGIAFIIMTVFVSICVIDRYRIFSASNFDFGIFAQLFENMAKSGSTVISVERNEMLSHFYNHFSPIYYVLLPLYMPFRRPEALLVIQAVFVFGSVFPFCLIAKKSGLSPLLVLIAGFVVLFAPGLIAPQFYDFHENKFLTFFILWFIYFFMEKKYIPAYIFMILTLMIKEDAVIYVSMTLVFFMIIKKDIKHGLIGLAISIAYSIPVMIFIRSYGLDFVGWRYGVYFLDGQNKIGQMFGNILMNPGFFIKNVFNEDCVKFTVYMMGPMLFISLAAKDFRKLVLLVPFVLLNVMTDYSYQHDIGFQYTYGSIALMMVLFLDNLKDINKNTKTFIVVSSAVVSLLFMTNVCKWKLEYYRSAYEENKDYYSETEKDLDRIPQDVSITCNTFLLPHICDHEELYMLDDSFERTDYYVFDANNTDEMAKFESSEYYSEYVKCLDGNKAIIYKLPEAPDLNE